MPLIRRTKQLIKNASPGLFRRAKTLRERYRFRMAHGGSEYRAKNALVSHFGKKIITGPFSGMLYGDDVCCSAYVAKLLGSYEEEIHQVLKQIISKQPSIIVDIGCAEGYYAVGLAKQLPSAKVYAFDTDSDAQIYCSELASLNGVVSQVIIGGLCDHLKLADLASQDTFILCDCEGFELELLDPAPVPGLTLCDILVELHEFLSPGLTATILQRFENTHTITLINTQERDINAYSALEHVLPEDRPWAVREGRPSSMQWAYLSARPHITV